jgi:dephospho-CoA kinase
MKLESAIIICGHISSGKSYAADLINKQFNIPSASFGGFLKYFCEQNSFPIDRQTLQNIGERLVVNNPKKFLIDVISYSAPHSNKIILEGVRHKSIFENIKLIAKNNLSIFIEADLETRYKRSLLSHKDSDKIKSFEQFIISDNHPVELEIESLKPLCDIIIDSTQDYSDIMFSQINIFLQQ